MDPRDYRLQEQQEQYEGPGFKQMMKDDDPENAGRRTRIDDIAGDCRQVKPNKKPAGHWYERIERTYYN